MSNSILNSILIHNLCPNSNLSNDLSTISATYRLKYEQEILSRAKVNTRVIYYTSAIIM